MADKKLFAPSRGKMVPKADTRNAAGGLAYSMSPEHALAQMVCTGCLGSTYYVSAKTQLDTILDLAQKVDPTYLAKLAVYGRSGHMKDTPALLTAVLAIRDSALLKKVFKRVIDNGRMLRNFCQIARSGQIGRKSFSFASKKLLKEYLLERKLYALWKDSVGQDPSIADIIKMAHPAPDTPERRAFFGYLIGKPGLGYMEGLPEFIQTFETWKRTGEGDPPNAPWEILTSFELKPEHWKSIARTAGWHALRMNLNTFKRHGVLDDPKAVEDIAKRLRDPEEIRRSRVFPYQLLIAYFASEDVPAPIRNALQDAMEVAVDNVPVIPGNVWVFPDVSGSMRSAVTGARGSATSEVACVHVAGLITAAFLRRNPNASVLPFSESVIHALFNPRDSVMTNAALLSGFGGGGTNCSAPLARLNAYGEKGDLLIYVSDNESWMDRGDTYGQVQGSQTMVEWLRFKVRNPQAKMVCIDLTPKGTAQVKEGSPDILQVGGFSDRVFDLIGLFAENKLSPDYWVGEINKVEL